MGVARLRLPEKLARTLSEAELPMLDRPVRFVVTRGARGAARASTLEALQEELERPFTEEELQAMNRDWRRSGKRGASGSGVGMAPARIAGLRVDTGGSSVPAAASAGRAVRTVMLVRRLTRVAGRGARRGRRWR